MAVFKLRLSEMSIFFASDQYLLVIYFDFKSFYQNLIVKIFLKINPRKIWLNFSMVETFKLIEKVAFL